MIVLALLRLSSDVNECKPLVIGQASPGQTLVELTGPPAQFGLSVKRVGGGGGVGGGGVGGGGGGGDAWKATVGGPGRGGRRLGGDASPKEASPKATRGSGSPRQSEVRPAVAVRLASVGAVSLKGVHGGPVQIDLLKPTLKAPVS
jgi:hypothetical protein